MREVTTETGWRALLAWHLVLTLCVLLGGVLLHSMNVLITATLLPSIVAELGGANLMSWPTTAFVASSIIAASGTGLVNGRFGNRRAFSGGAVIYAAGAVLCACAPSIGLVIAGRFVQGLGGGLLSALAYVLVRNAFPEALWPRVFGLLSGVWSVTVLIGPLIGGVFASYGHCAVRLLRSRRLVACSPLAPFSRLPPISRVTRRSTGLFQRAVLP